MINALKNDLSQRALITTIREFNQGLQCLKVPQAVAWAMPYISEVKDVYAKLFESQIL